MKTPCNIVIEIQLQLLYLKCNSITITITELPIQLRNSITCRPISITEQHWANGRGFECPWFPVWKREIGRVCPEVQKNKLFSTLKVVFCFNWFFCFLFWR